jgi:methionine-rich copper-binding protein CopC
MSTNQKGPIAIRLTAVLLLAVVMLVPRSIFAAASLTISSPAAGATVSGSVTVSADDNANANTDPYANAGGDVLHQPIRERLK